MRPTLYLVGCCGPKLAERAPARDLYTSDLFRKSRALAEANGAEWAILSAKHLAIAPEKVIEPYDLRLEDLTAQGRESWALWTNTAIRMNWPGRRYVLLAGEAYRACLKAPVALTHEAPLEGLGIGERLAWLKREGGLFAAAS